VTSIWPNPVAALKELALEPPVTPVPHAAGQRERGGSGAEDFREVRDSRFLRLLEKRNAPHPLHLKFSSVKLRPPAGWGKMLKRPGRLHHTYLYHRFQSSFT